MRDRGQIHPAFFDDSTACRVCGCTSEHACEGGCWWVWDPEGLGPLCSTCRFAMASSPENAV